MSKFIFWAFLSLALIVASWQVEYQDELELGAIFCLMVALIYLGFELLERFELSFISIQRARASTPLNKLAEVIADFTPSQLEVIRQAGILQVRAHLGLAGFVDWGLVCPDNHVIPFYDEAGNDLQTLIADLARVYPILKLSNYSNNSKMQNHLRSFITALTFAGFIEPAVGNQPAKWAKDASPRLVAQKLGILED